MRLKRLLLLAALTVLSTATFADAGPLARLFGRGGGGARGGHCGGCGGCGGQPVSVPAGYPVQYQAPPVTVPQQGTLHLTSYLRVPEYRPQVTPEYQPIRLAAPLPTCPTCPK